MPFVVPSEWYACDDQSPNLKDEKYYSIWGTLDDHIYGRKKLEEKYERVEEYIPTGLKTLGIINFSELERDKFRPKQEVTEVGILGQHWYTDTALPERQTILLERKYKCTGELDTTD